MDPGDQFVLHLLADADELVDPAGMIYCLDGTCTEGAFPDRNASHGNQVAEVIHELAPSAALYIGRAGTSAELQSVVDFFAANDA